jgi:hypothetical protein
MPLYVQYRGKWYELSDDQSPPTEVEFASLPEEFRERALTLKRTKDGAFVPFEAPVGVPPNNPES